MPGANISHCSVIYRLFGPAYTSLPQLAVNEQTLHSWLLQCKMVMPCVIYDPTAILAKTEPSLPPIGCLRQLNWCRLVRISVRILGLAKWKI